MLAGHNIGIIEITPELVHDMLRLPPELSIVGVVNGGLTWHVLVQGAAVPDGTPHLCPAYVRDKDGEISLHGIKGLLSDLPIS